MAPREPDDRARRARRARALSPWAAYGAMAAICTAYLNGRAKLVPQIGQWYAAGPPYVLLQVRAFLSGRLAMLPHFSSGAMDSHWGRGGLHQAWGLGLPILAAPFHAVARVVGAPGFPDDLLFLVFYAATAVTLARALHRSAPGWPLATSTAAAGLLMLLPTFVGLLSSRFLIYEQTIAMGALWDIGLLSGLLLLNAECTTPRLVALCAAAGFAVLIRAPLAIYGISTAVWALLVARRNGLGARSLVAGAGAYGGVAALFPASNALRFGAPWITGYATVVAPNPLVNVLSRWGLPFSREPLWAAAKEMFATLFLLDPIPTQITFGPVPAAVAPYATALRWREYYAPTFDLPTLAMVLGSFAIVLRLALKGHLWRAGRADPGALAGAWGGIPMLVLFFFYARIDNMVSRYATDLVPAVAAAFLCVVMTVDGALSRRSPSMGVWLQIGIAAAWPLYLASWRGWATHLSQPVDRRAISERIAEIDRTNVFISGVPEHFASDGLRGADPVPGAHLRGWEEDGRFPSGMVFAMPHASCVSFTFSASGPAWNATYDAELAGFRARADSDELARCGPAVTEGETRTLTMCEPHSPRYLLDGLRLYAVAALDPSLVPLEWLRPDERLRLTRIDAVGACP